MEQKKFVFILNHSFDSADTAAGALQLAANMKAFDIELDIFLINEGVLIAKKDFESKYLGRKKRVFLLSINFCKHSLRISMCSSTFAPPA